MDYLLRIALQAVYEIGCARILDDELDLLILLEPIFVFGFEHYFCSDTSATNHHQTKRKMCASSVVGDRVQSARKRTKGAGSNDVAMNAADTRRSDDLEEKEDEEGGALSVSDCGTPTHVKFRLIWLDI